MISFGNSVADAVINTATVIRARLEATISRGNASEVIAPESFRATQDKRRSFRWDGELGITLDHNTEGLFPEQPGDLLTNFGTEVEMRVGVQLADGSEYFVPYGHYLVDQSSMTISGGGRLVTLRLVDLAQRVADYRFESPISQSAARDIANAVRVVIRNRTGEPAGVTNVGVTLGSRYVFGLDPEKDPWRELQDLVQSKGYNLWYDHDGELVLAPAEVEGENLIVMDGPLTASIDYETRPENVVVARSSAPDIRQPIQAVAMDDDPSSPTYAGANPGDSPYGRITRYYASPLLRTVGQAQQAAESILAGLKGAGASWTVTRPFDPMLEPDDVISVNVGTADDPSFRTLAVDAVSLSVPGTTTLNVREFQE